jgi:ferredoxin-type protein NapH
LVTPIQKKLPIFKPKESEKNNICSSFMFECAGKLKYRFVMNKNLNAYLAFLIGILIAFLLYFFFHWWGFLLIFTWIGGWITAGNIISLNKKGIKKDIGRKISILMISPVFLIFLGLMQRENLQLEETIFYIAAGWFTRVLIHFTIAKIFGPFIWGRGFCGWACWTAAVLEWLPISDNKTIPVKYTKFRYVVFLISILVPVIFIYSGYDYYNHQLKENGNLIGESAKYHQLLWFIFGNGIYYASAIPLAFIFRKKRAFCKIACPVSLVMKIQTVFSIIKRRPTEKKCIECEICNRNCPMDINVMNYIIKSKKISSTECILCGMCVNVCPVSAIM